MNSPSIYHTFITRRDFYQRRDRASIAGVNVGATAQALTNYGHTKHQYTINTLFFNKNLTGNH